MIRILFLASAIVLFSCTSNNNPVTEKAEIATASVHFKSLSVPVPFPGSWISETYLEDIRKHQSPRKAQENSQECFIRLPDQTLKTATMIYNFHEAVGDLVIVNHNGTYELWEKQHDTLSKVVYTIEQIAPDTLSMGKKNFVKIDPETSGDRALILESILFAGKYKDKQGKQVEFKGNGEVTGLGKYKFFTPVIDYFDAGLQVDQVGLGETRDKMDYFGFTFKKEKLNLYSLKCVEVDPVDQRCVEVDFGQKKFELQNTLLEQHGH